MYHYSVSILTGAMIAVMVAINGQLTAHVGGYAASVITHLAGLIPVTVWCLLRKEKLFARRRLPWSWYLGGVIGVGTTLFNNMAFGKISVSAIVALGMLGQAITALVVDHFGFLGLERRPFRLYKLCRFPFVLGGVALMLAGTGRAALLPVVLSLLSGVTSVLSRSWNARIAVRSGFWASTWYNFMFGLCTSLLVAFALAGQQLAGLPDTLPATPAWAFTGGMVGCLMVFLTNVAACKIPAFYVAMLSFAGQMFAGILLDIWLSGSFSAGNLWGGALAVLGLVLDQLLSRRYENAAS